MHIFCYLYDLIEFWCSFCFYQKFQNITGDKILLDYHGKKFNFVNEKNRSIFTVQKMKFSVMDLFRKTAYLLTL